MYLKLDRLRLKKTDLDAIDLLYEYKYFLSIYDLDIFTNQFVK